jgi:bifunctional non-homologous end joining protein LigD
MMASSTLLKVDGRALPVSHLDRVLFADDHTTKSDVIAYYVKVAPLLLTILRRRPVMRVRWPSGTAQPGFYERQLPAGTPSWVHRVALPHEARMVEYPLVDSRADLAWLAQVGAIELHTPQWRLHAGNRRVDRVIFDLDPGPGTDLRDCAALAQTIRELLERQGHRVVPVTSGRKGVHVYVPWTPSRDGSGSVFARDLAESLARSDERIVAHQTKADRVGRILIDWSQNNEHKTTVSPLSLRGTDSPYVAAVRTWSEMASPRLEHMTIAEASEAFGPDCSDEIRLMCSWL